MKNYIYISLLIVFLLFIIYNFLQEFIHIGKKDQYMLSEGYKSSYSGPSGYYSTLDSPSTTMAPSSSQYKSNYHLDDLNVMYHDSLEDIQTQTGMDPSANLVTVLDPSGHLIQIPISQTMNDTTYYNENLLKYDPANYVPTYEDTIYFSKLTGLGYQTPIHGTDSQWGGFCSYNKNFPDKIEEKCGKLDNDTCATTSCCVLLGGAKCVAGDQNGPRNKATYNDPNIKRRDKYFFEGKCYGNCVDDQTTYYNYNNELLTKNDNETHKLQLKTSPYESTDTTYQNYNSNPSWSDWNMNVSVCATQFPNCDAPCGKNVNGVCVYQGPVSGPVAVSSPSPISVSSPSPISVSSPSPISVSSPSPISVPSPSPITVPSPSPVQSITDIRKKSMCSLFHDNSVISTTEINDTKCNNDANSFFCKYNNSCQPFNDLINNGKGDNNINQTKLCNMYFYSLFSDSSFITNFNKNWRNIYNNDPTPNETELNKDLFTAKCKNIVLN